MVLTSDESATEKLETATSMFFLYQAACFTLLGPIILAAEYSSEWFGLNLLLPFPSWIKDFLFFADFLLIELMTVIPIVVGGSLLIHKTLLDAVEFIVLIAVVCFTRLFRCCNSIGLNRALRAALVSGLMGVCMFIEEYKAFCTVTMKLKGEC